MELENKILRIKNLIKNLENNIQVTYPITESKKILLISLEKSREAISECINLALILEYKRNRIKHAKNKQKNLENFFKVCSQDIGITNREINRIKEILSLAKSARKSSINFKRNEEIILLSRELTYRKLNIERIKDYKNLIEVLLEKIILAEKILNKNYL